MLCRDYDLLCLSFSTFELKYSLDVSFDTDFMEANGTTSAAWMGEGDLR
jgi:hypothetical protein